MDDTRAKEFIKKVFESEFSKESFTLFIRNLLNTFDESKAFHAHGYVKEVFTPHIKTYERLGTYTDPNDNKIDILIVYLQKETSIERARSMQRNFVAEYLKGRNSKDAALVAFVSPDPSDWRFSFVKMEYEMKIAENGKIKVSDTFTPVKRYSFLVGPHEASHTAQSRMLPHLKNSITHPTLSELEELFSVEKVTNEFFDEYKDLFADLVDSFSHNEEFNQNVVQKNGIDVADFSKKLLGQVVFLYFLQKKGWLGVKEGSKWGTGDKFFMTNLYKSGYGSYSNFFNDIIEPLFYDTLNRRDRGNSSVMGDQSWSPRFHCKIPYLNGGLFTPTYEWEKTNIKIENERFQKIFEVFDRYNFTVYEPDPIEKEVAVDPEMLGKVFERLLDVNDRKGSGAYYTPREIVQYMCRESLITYLKNNSDIEEDRIRSFFDRKDHELGETEAKRARILANEGLRDRASTLYDLLKKVKVCDPAVGSGAFPMGLLKEISSARHYLNTFFIHEKNEKGNELTEYDIKKQTLENCIYGVDIEAGAVEIARLRFWLALIVEHDIEDVEPLPNLDYKIMQGNSLIEQLPEVDSKQRDKDINDLYEKLAEAKHNLFNLTDGSKKEDKIMIIQEVASEIALYTKIKPIREKIREIRNTPSLFGKISKDENQLNFDEFLSEDLRREYKKIDEIQETHPKSHFEWHLNYSEVFEKGGFDIVIGNPPYVEFKNLEKEIKNLIESRFQSTTGKYDLYIPFYENSIRLLKDQGVIAFISPTRFMHRGYGEALRKLLLEQVTINIILDFVDHQVFNAALTYTGVFIFQKGKQDNRKAKSIRYIRLKKDIYDETFEQLHNGDIFEEIYIDQDKLSILPWYISNDTTELLLKKIEESKTKLSDLCEGIYQGIATGKDEVFVIDKSIIDQYKIETGIAIPFLRGKNISKYFINWKNTYLIYPYDRQGQPLKESQLQQTYPNVYRYLVERKNQLKGRKYFDESTKHWYELWNQRNLNRFYREKIMTLDNSKSNSFAYDNSNFVGSTTTYSLILNNPNISYKYLLGVLNSSLLDFYHKKKTIPQAGGYFRYQASFINGLPILTEDGDDQSKSEIIGCVEEIIKLRSNSDYRLNEKMQNAVKGFEVKIDRIIYKLYGLTEDEIRIIEN